jgi:hypothetical protein
LAADHRRRGSRRGRLALPVFIVGLGVLMDQIGHTGTTWSSRSKSAGSSSAHGRVRASRPSGEVELTKDRIDWPTTNEPDVRVGPPLRPMFARPDMWNLPLVTCVLVAMIAVIPIARVLRNQP